MEQDTNSRPVNVSQAQYTLLKIFKGADFQKPLCLIIYVYWEKAFQIVVTFS